MTPMVPKLLSSVCLSFQRSGEAQRVSIGVFYMEISLAPLGVPGSSIRLQTVSNSLLIKSIQVGDVEDYPAPPRHRASRLGDKVQVPAPHSEAGERRLLSAIQHFEPQRTVETDCSGHGRRRASLSSPTESFPLE